MYTERLDVLATSTFNLTESAKFQMSRTARPQGELTQPMLMIVLPPQPSQPEPSSTCRSIEQHNTLSLKVSGLIIG
ncbi:hypothetical protein PGTUg99_032750 [Puccinia graminis f. sp. tritici]|uniref:Uncharacterized protein n=1 Tax=Puccinia graminis f. sp. tritici TaxID=56615 RepID=A0A5B0P4P4_PUCGR|nr:hypothetical protein PGTUg99_032750 [Puccinia graminis f. sp. tritici]